MYGRSHSYSPFSPYGLFHRESEEKNLLLTCFSTGSKKKFDLKHYSNESEIIVNVDIDSGKFPVIFHVRLLSIWVF